MVEENSLWTIFICNILYNILFPNTSFIWNVMFCIVGQNISPQFFAIYCMLMVFVEKYK